MVKNKELRIDYELPSGSIIEEREAETLTIKKADYLKRIIYRICTNGTPENKDLLTADCWKIIERENKFITDNPTEKLYGAIAFFFWASTDDVGYVASEAAYDYAPDGKWEDAEKSLNCLLCPKFLLEEQYYRY